MPNWLKKLQSIWHLLFWPLNFVTFERENQKATFNKPTR
jgi:hypothetical protein